MDKNSSQSWLRLGSGSGERLHMFFNISGVDNVEYSLLRYFGFFRYIVFPMYNVSRHSAWADPAPGDPGRLPGLCSVTGH
jgi:hypothetical protein